MACSLLACFSSKAAVDDQSRHDEQTYGKFRVFSYHELKYATDDFHFSNKVGEGGFGSVYKGQLRDGTMVAVKVLSIELESMRGEREFLAELASLSDVNHENLVTLRGCCVEASTRYLVYDYMENNSISHTLLGGVANRTKFTWERRWKVLIGVARGLLYLHEGVAPRILHRDIKASNILLDRNFTPKVSDFGLARLLRDENSHISTRVAGTFGYLAPEYAVSGHLTRKSDVYSFGVLILEVVSGQPVVDIDDEYKECFLVQKAWAAHEADDLISLVDSVLNKEFPEQEAMKLLKLGLLCVQETSRLRPKISLALEILTNAVDMTDTVITRPGIVSDFMKIKMGHRPLEQLQESSSGEANYSTFWSSAHSGR